MGDPRLHGGASGLVFEREMFEPRDSIAKVGAGMCSSTFPGYSSQL